MKQFWTTTWAGCALMTSLVLACSGEPGLDDTDWAEADDMPTESSVRATLLDAEALSGGVVSSEEVRVLEAYLARSSLGAPTSIDGRLLHWEDAMMTVDDVLFLAAHLDEAPSIEKGYAAHSIANPKDVNSIEFWRPDIGGLIYVIVEDAVSTNVFNAVRDVALGWTGLSVDCLGQSAFQTIRRSAYNALTQNQRDISYEITFRYITSTTPGWKCATGQSACMDFPGPQQVKVNGTFVSRIAVGDEMQVNSNTHPASDIPGLEKILRHEFGHGFGFQHQQLDAVHIPGTTSCGINCFNPGDLYPSVMRSGGAGGVFILPEDDKSMRTLYANVANRPNDDCQYLDGFRVLAKLP